MSAGEVAAVMFGTHISELQRQGEAEQPPAFVAEAPMPQSQLSVQTVRLSGFERIRRDRQGHYVGDFRLNNHRVKGLIDTGATTIAINESVARRAGIFLRRDDFKYTVNTANGVVRAARATINNVQIGQIRVAEVEAAVLPDEALDVVLVGTGPAGALRTARAAGSRGRPRLLFADGLRGSALFEAVPRNARFLDGLHPGLRQQWRDAHL